jgi:uncharacterized membrane-anchored protein
LALSKSKRKNKSKANIVYHKVLISVTVLLLSLLFCRFLLTNVLGETIKLQTLPLNADSLLYGGNVNIDFAIQNIPIYHLDKALKAELLEESPNYTTLTEVYVTLKEANSGTHSVIKVRKNKPHSGIYFRANLVTTVSNNKVKLLLPNNSHYINEAAMEKIAGTSKDVVFVTTFKTYKGYLIYKETNIKILE